MGAALQGWDQAGVDVSISSLPFTNFPLGVRPPSGSGAGSADD